MKVLLLFAAITFLLGALSAFQGDYTMAIQMKLSSICSSLLAIGIKK